MRKIYWALVVIMFLTTVPANAQGPQPSHQIPDGIRRLMESNVGGIAPLAGGSPAQVGGATNLNGPLNYQRSTNPPMGPNSGSSYNPKSGGISTTQNFLTPASTTAGGNSKSQLVQALDGRWTSPANPISPHSQSINAPSSPDSVSQPDPYGYYWNDSVALSWIDATTGTNSGIGAGTAVSGPFTLPFTFKYYVAAFTTFYISKYGYIGFVNNSLDVSQSRIPSRGLPNNIIAPYWAPLLINEGGYAGSITIINGGVAPNRYEVIEWLNAHDQYSPDSNIFTFEVILYETGNIKFQYKDMTYTAAAQYYCGQAGIEDADGVEGLAHGNFCDSYPSNAAVTFYRPAPSARLRIDPVNASELISRGGTTYTALTIENNGDFGPDTYDLHVTPLSSDWNYTLYASDGYSQLGDTNGNGIPDTGQLQPGETRFYYIGITAVSSAAIGENAYLTMRLYSSVNSQVSKKFVFRVAIPAPFVQVDANSYYDENLLMMIQPDIQGYETLLSTRNGAGIDPSITEAPNGNLIYGWMTEAYCVDTNCTIGANEPEFTILDSVGDAIKPSTRLLDHSQVTATTYDYSMATAVTPNNQIGLVWREYINNNSLWNCNIWFAVVDSTGNIIQSPINLTNNSTWGNDGDDNFHDLYSAHISATSDNHFVIVWEDDSWVSSASLSDIFMTVRSTSGGQLLATTNLTNNTVGGPSSYNPDLTVGNSSQVLLTYQFVYFPGVYSSRASDIYYEVIDSNGNIIKTATALTNDGVHNWNWQNPDAVKLFDGHFAVSWAADGPYNVGETTWSAQFYNNEDLSGTPALTRTDNTIDFFWQLDSPGPGVNPDHFSARWTGTINVPAGGYSFYMTSDDGSRLSIDGTVVMDHWNDSSNTWGQTVQLTAGSHQVILEMHEISGWASVILMWIGTTTPSQSIRYAILDSSYNISTSAAYLGTIPANTNSSNSSITATGGGKAVITWLDNNNQCLYYALVNSAGAVLTQPIIIDQNVDPNSKFWTSYEGNGNTTYTPAARLEVYQPDKNQQVNIGSSVDYYLYVYNLGAIGADTFDIDLSSSWPIALFKSDGVTLLTDTDSDGKIDTGLVQQGKYAVIIARVSPPAGTKVGDSDLSTFTLTSSINPSKSKGVSMVTTARLPVSGLIPFITYNTNKTTFFPGPWEEEPNNSFNDANGLLISGQAYYGYPNDQWDYFIIKTTQTGTIVIDLANFSGKVGAGQLIFYQNKTFKDAATRPGTNGHYHLTENSMPAGIYYVVIGRNPPYDTQTPYTLIVTYP